MTERDGLGQRDIQPRNPVERHTEADRQPHDMHTTPMTHAAQQSKTKPSKIPRTTMVERIPINS